MHRLFRSSTLVGFALTVVLGLPACSTTRTRPAVAPGRGLILISIDTLRRDHLGCYGYWRDTSPSVDAFRKDAILFDQAIAQGPSTLISHASLFTSLIPQHHGAVHRIPVSDDLLTLAEVFRSAGFRTASYNGGGRLDSVYGFGQGFETVQSSRFDSRFHDVVKAGTEWLDQHGNEPYFLFLHTYEVHLPYDPPAECLALFPESYSGSLPDKIVPSIANDLNGDPRVRPPGKRRNRRQPPHDRAQPRYSAADLAHVVRSYDAGIRSMDSAFGELISYLKTRGLYDDTVIIFTSDHGEEFGEHGKVAWHSHTLYDELLRVPLIMKTAHSRDAGATVAFQVRLIDVAPTALEAVGVPVPEVFEGVSLLGTIEQDPPESLPAVSLRSPKYTSLRKDGWKWVHRSIFNLKEDPGELHNLARKKPDVEDALHSQLDELVAARDRPTTAPVTIDPGTQEQLRALGYVD
jgi:arylsulfatase A-like enzyme